ncbi:P-loop NTPase fold protein [Pedobacter sp.]|uniref:P-loop NTPase fold protein n=1 Tax=Pedobacter sp. TaxID=1411316 RepID=UPI003BAC651B
MQKLKIETPDIAKDFKNHLDIPGNNSILFSAPFGAGKTTFLDDFFRANTEEYNFVHLYPVYYSVSGNEDIFELIKYDILFELMLKYRSEIALQDGDLDFSRSLALQLYINNEFKPLDLFQKLASIIYKTGKEISEVISIAKESKGDFEEYFKKIREGKIEVIEEYTLAFEMVKGSVYEYDSISKMIAGILTGLKEPGFLEDVQTEERASKDKPKENVLIIDDLDRIDPEHVFRIFNIFSAHQDWKTYKNKFGFDKVIVVCDVKNIRYIYEHRYGKNVDFVGYINKFYSSHVYAFDNAAHVISNLRGILDTLNTKAVEKADIYHPLKKYDLRKHEGNYFSLSLTYVLNALVKTGLLELRSIMGMSKFNIRKYKFFNEGNSGFEGDSIDYEILIFIQFFCQLFGSLDAFEIKLDQLSEVSTSDPRYVGIIDSAYEKDWGTWIIDYCLPVLNTMDAKIDSTNLKISLGDKQIIYRAIEENRKTRYQFLRVTDAVGVEVKFSELNLFVLLKETLRKSKIKGILK